MSTNTTNTSSATLFNFGVLLVGIGGGLFISKFIQSLDIPQQTSESQDFTTKLIDKELKELNDEESGVEKISIDHTRENMANVLRELVELGFKDCSEKLWNMWNEEMALNVIR